MPPPSLFSKARLREYLQTKRERAESEARRVPEHVLRSSDLDDLASSLAHDHLVEPLVLYEDRMTGDHREAPFAPARPTVATFFFHIPFSGDAELFFLQPPKHTTAPPRAGINRDNRTAVISVDIGPNTNAAAAARSTIALTLDLIRIHLGHQEAAIQHHNKLVPANVATILCFRLSALDKNKAVLASLGIPLATKPGAPQLPIRLDQKIQIRRIDPGPHAPHAAQANRDIGDEDYSNILSLIRHQCRTFETAPDAYVGLDEERLRDLIRASLNAVYQASGEAFRNHGKTDICIEADDRSAFVAECKVWEGGKGLQDAIDQLLRYLTWRDCKTAIVIFNKDVKRFTELVATKVAPAFEGHPQYERTLPAPTERGEWRFELNHTSGHRVVCHLMMFDLLGGRRPSP